MTDETYRLDTLPDFVGRELGVSDWLTIDQARINQFADVTGDHQWIHVDVERAARESPGGKTISHGFLTLSFLPLWQGQLGVVPAGVKQVFNYGLDRLRFLAPVPAGARVRLRVVLADVTVKRPGQILIKTGCTVELEGSDRPALVADMLFLVIA